jgi:hypothetical protein
VFKIRTTCIRLAILHFFVGLGAIFGGGAALLNPVGPLGFPIEMLAGSPFSDFFIPGLILFAVIGLGSIFAGITAILQSSLQGYYSSVVSWALMIWIVVQCLMINTVVFVHVFYFFIGLAGAIMAFVILYKKRQFPATLINLSLKRADKL